jgi:hypothetical protein
MSYLLSLGLKNVEVFYMIRIKRKNEFGRSPLLAKTWNKESYREAVSYISKFKLPNLILSDHQI